MAISVQAELEKCYTALIKTRAIQTVQEKKLLRLINSLRRSLQSEADTGSARSDDRLGLDMERQDMPG